MQNTAGRTATKPPTDWKWSSRISYRFRRFYLPSHGGFGDKHDAGHVDVLSGFELSRLLVSTGLQEQLSGCRLMWVRQDLRDQPLQQPDAQTLLRPDAQPLEHARTAQITPFTSLGLRGVVCQWDAPAFATRTHTQESKSSGRIQALTWTLNDPYFLLQK